MGFFAVSSLEHLFSSTSLRPPQIIVQCVDHHPVDGVAVFLGVFLNTLGETTWNVDSDRLGVIGADDRIRVLFHAGPLGLVGTI